MPDWNIDDYDAQTKRLAELLAKVPAVDDVQVPAKAPEKAVEARSSLFATYYLPQLYGANYRLSEADLEALPNGAIVVCASDAQATPWVKTGIYTGREWEFGDDVISSSDLAGSYLVYLPGIEGTT